MSRNTLFALLYLTCLLPVTYTLVVRFESTLLVRSLVNLCVLGIIAFFVSPSEAVAKETSLTSPFPGGFGSKESKKSSAPVSSKTKKILRSLLTLCVGGLFFVGSIDAGIKHGITIISDYADRFFATSSTTVIAPSSTSGDVVNTGDVISATGAIDSVELVVPVVPPIPPVVEKIESMPSVTPRYKAGTYGFIVPHLLKTYNIPYTSKTDIAFTAVNKTNDLYPAFATAYTKGMIGKTISPGTTVSCDTYIVLKGIAANREVYYTGSPFAAYRAEAIRKKQLNGCVKGKFVTSKNL